MHSTVFHATHKCVAVLSCELRNKKNQGHLHKYRSILAFLFHTRVLGKYYRFKILLFSQLSFALQDITVVRDTVGHMIN